jgi:hypothetical protein
VESAAPADVWKRPLEMSTRATSPVERHQSWLKRCVSMMSLLI